MRGKRLTVKVFVYLAFVAWLAGIVFLVGYRVRHPVPENPNAQRNERQSERIAGVNFSNAAPDNGQGNDNQSYAQKWFEPIVILTFLLVIGVGGTAYIYWRQLKKMEETVALVGKQEGTMRDQLTAMQGQLVAVQDQVEIMEGQAKSMDESVVYGLRAYVGVHSIDYDPETDRVFLQVENIGKVPAENIDVFIEIEVKVPAKFLPFRPFIERVLNDEPDGPQTTTFGFRYRFGRKAKLFPGNLKIKIRIPLEPWFREELPLIRSGAARLVARGNINFMDGFHKDKNSPFSFRYRLSDKCWFPHPLLSADDLRKKQIEEIPYYEDEDEKETD